ncbi:MAG TPA: purine-nucleoside phosphorylase [Chloroflexota bacterium]|nr:purine-nucleoside phosphorylase [Chloroflexota bacterium]
MRSESERIAEAMRWIRRHSSATPRFGIILGSGLGSVAAQISQPECFQTASIPYFPASTVSGHAGELILGSIGGVTVAVLSGRVHGYEGHKPAALSFGVRIFRALGCSEMILTSASGALNPDFRSGDVMLIEDHISLPGLAGHSPLIGPEVGPGLTRFVDLSEAYDPALRVTASAVASEAGIHLRRGIYVMVGGPQYETPAEVRFLRSIGGDAVGMSTVPEVIVGRQLGMRVLALSVISNAAAGILHEPITHEAVLAAVEKAAKSVGTIIVGVVTRTKR